MILVQVRKEWYNYSEVVNLGKTSTATKNAWNAKAYDQLRVIVHKGQKEQIANHAASKGMSLNAYINALIAADMGEELTKPEKKEQGE